MIIKTFNSCFVRLSVLIYLRKGFNLTKLFCAKLKGGVHHENAQNHEFFELMMIFQPEWPIRPHARNSGHILPYIITSQKGFEIEPIVFEKKLSNVWKPKSAKFDNGPPWISDAHLRQLFPGMDIHCLNILVVIFTFFPYPYLRTKELTQDKNFMAKPVVELGAFFQQFTIQKIFRMSCTFELFFFFLVQRKGFKKKKEKKKA